MQQQDKEFRVVPINVGSEGKLEGLAIAYNSLSEDLGGFREMILPGAATESLKRNIFALYNHEPGAILGRTSSGTLTLRESDKGIEYSINLPNTSAGNDLRELVKRGDVNGASFGFSVPKGGQKWFVSNGEKLRHLSRIDVAEISVTANPAYAATSAALRSLHQWNAEQEQLRMKARLAELN